MKNLPLYMLIGPMAITFLTLFFLYKASGNSKKVLFISLAWLSLQAAVGLSGFYTVTDSIPPRFMLTLFPPLMAIAALFFTKRGNAFLDSLNAKWLTLLHVVRVPVEMMLLALFLQKYVPQLMTFEGRNFDILSGLTAPIVFYFGYIRKTISRTVLLSWNFICIALLLNIVINAVFAAPFPFQRFAFEQPNVAVLYFPFVWLPAFIVPAVLLSHLACIRQLRQRKSVGSSSHVIPHPA
ncbi:MAG TPA: hypothetical protein VM871_12020 [Flavisolibacter sp.]|jgi:hypothetical protein|nr:hypothetical protein [Flavisolibacter sp.]